MSNAYRQPGEVDATEIAREEVRQAGETKRKQIEQREDTKREAIKSRNSDGGVAVRVGGCFVAGIGIIAASLVASGYFSGRAPRQCVESAEIASSSAPERTCAGGGTLDVQLLPQNHMLVRCTCGAARPLLDGGS